MYVLETNGMTLGYDREYAQALARFSKLHVRVSIKGANADEFHSVTGAQRSSYELPFVALQNLMDAGVSCNACLMQLFFHEEKHSGF